MEIKKQTYSQLVVEYLRERILKGDYLPGSKIKEVELSQKLSISRAPIREALQVLVQEGLIVSKPQKGKYIVALTEKQIKDSYFTGAVLEAAAVANAIERYSEADINDLQAIVAEMGLLAEPYDPDNPNEGMAELDNRFHRVLFAKIDNDLIVDLCRRTCQGISKFLLYKHWLRLFTPSEMVKRHQQIVDTLKTKNALKAEAVIRNHYIEAGERMSKFGVDVYKEKPGADL